MRKVIKSYKDYMKIRKLVMTLTKVFNTLTSALAQLFVVIGVLAVFAEIVDRISTRKYLKEHESEGKIGKEVKVMKEHKF